LNNYHPNITDVSLQLLHYSPIRYQTKLYDKRLNSFSVFGEEGQELIEFYHWLRKWSEFFKPKEIFSAMDDNKAQEEAETMLQNFEIESGTIRCTDSVALQALIPYVKRLLQLFPQIKDGTKVLCHLMRLERGYISLKQGVMLNGLTKSRWNLTPILRV